MKKKPMKKKPVKKATKKATKKAVKKPKKRVSKIGTMAQVMAGKKEKTKAGHTKADLISNGHKIVSKKKAASGAKLFSNIATWVAACKQARADLGLTGFVAVKKGTPLYNKAKELV